MKPLILLTVWSAFSTISLVAGNWPQFRGPQACGVDTNGVAPIHWNIESGENLLWRTTIPGLSHASPILWNDRVYVATAVRPGKADLKVGLYGDIESADDTGSQQWRLIAVDKATGKIEWNVLGYEGVPRVKRHPKATHCNTTPATDGKRIVAIFGSEGLFCFDMEGKLLWRKDLGPMDSGYYQVPSAQWGFASSPVIHDGKVVVVCDVQKNSFLAVFDLADGKEVWRTARKDVPGWGSPTVAQVGDQTRILVNGWHHIGGYDFTTGKEVWRLNGGGDIPVPTPVVSSGLAYFTSAHGNSRPMRAIRLDAEGDITPKEIGGTNAAIAWVHPRQGCYMQTPLVTGGSLYGCFDNGVVTCFDAQTGVIAYGKRIGTGSEGFTASPVSDGRHVYFTSEGGNVYVMPTNGKFEINATNTLGETCLASPAISEGILYFRTAEHLSAIGRKNKGE
ncbi:MAG TPA: PQQ-binding-like beta-propeller repeat protein [Candidatus Limnocylindria bacterium]|nr:PQQ-binding-like beta-propeller repeat protein [Candidatus Limnocylindria bacterium]